MDVPALPAGRWQRGGDVFGDDGKVTVHGKQKVWAGGGGEGEALAHLGTATSINHSCFLPGDKAQERLLPPLQGHEGELGHLTEWRSTLQPPPFPGPETSREGNSFKNTRFPRGHQPCSPGQPAAFPVLGTPLLWDAGKGSRRFHFLF